MKLDPKILRAAAELRLRMRRTLNSPTGGAYRTRFRGTGMQFKEFRQYEIGDDIRHMAWTVTARTRRPTIKLYDEERNLEVCIVLDTSRSSSLGAGGKQKFGLYTDLAAVFALAALRRGDSFSLALFSEGTPRFYPASRSRTRLGRVLDDLITGRGPHGGTDVAAALEHVRKTLSSRSLVVVLSDFTSPPFAGALSALARRHEVIGIHASDPIERGMGEGIYETVDPETGVVRILDLGSRVSRSHLHDEHEKTKKRLSQLFASHGAEYLHLDTEDDHLGTVVRYFRSRLSLARG